MRSTVKKKIIRLAVIDSSAQLIYQPKPMHARSQIEKIAYYGFLLTAFVAASAAAFILGVDRPVVIGIFVGIVACSAVILPVWQAFLTIIISTLVLLIIGSLHIYLSRLGWWEVLYKPAQLLEYVMLYNGLLGAHWWYVARLQASYQALVKKEHDLKTYSANLENELKRRTNVLFSHHAQTIAALHQAAEQGRMIRGYFHDLMKPCFALILTAEEIPHAAFRGRFSVPAAECLNASKRLKELLYLFQADLAGTQHLQHIPLKTLIENIIQLHEYTLLKSKVAVELEIPPEATLYASPRSMNQLIHNLLGNCIDALETSSKKLIRMRVIQTANTVVLLCIDSGPGMSTAVLQQARQPFFTTHSESHHMGLGLSIIQHIVTHELHGTIQFRNRPGGGLVTTIVIAQQTSEPAHHKAS